MFYVESFCLWLALFSFSTPHFFFFCCGELAPPAVQLRYKRADLPQKWLFWSDLSILVFFTCQTAVGAFKLVFLVFAEVPAPRWGLVPPGAELPSAYGGGGGARAGPGGGEEPLPDRERARICHPRSHLTYEGRRRSFLCLQASCPDWSVSICLCSHLCFKTTWHTQTQRGWRLLPDGVSYMWHIQTPSHRNTAAVQVSSWKSLMLVPSREASRAGSDLHLMNASFQQTLLPRDVTGFIKRFPPPDVLYSGPDVFYSGPDVLYSGPDVLYSGPDVLYSGPDVLYSGTDVFRTGVQHLVQTKEPLTSGSGLHTPTRPT